MGNKLTAEHLDIGWTARELSFQRAKVPTQAGALTSRIQRLPRIALTHQELKEAKRIRYEKDEPRDFRFVREGSSAACATFIDLGLPRHIVRKVLDELSDRRALQVTLRGISHATRFKFSDEGVLPHTTYVECGAEDTFHHLLKCADFTPPPPAKDSAWYYFWWS